jgi:Protein of unknown function (DUF2939)
MKRFITGFVLAVVLVSAYWAWPFVGLHAIAADVRARDAAALSKDVDFPSLARSLSEQIIAAYLRVTGQAAPLGNLGAVLASAIGSSVADPLISQIVNPENLTALLHGGTVSTQFGPVAFGMGELPAISLSSVSTAWRAWLGSEYRLDHFSIALPVGAPPAEQYRLRLQLIQWHWKLTGVDLPEALRTQLAQELAKKLP